MNLGDVMVTEGVVYATCVFAWIGCAIAFLVAIAWSDRRATRRALADAQTLADLEATWNLPGYTRDEDDDTVGDGRRPPDT